MKMNRFEGVELAAGLGFLAFGAAHYLGWPPVFLGLGIVLVLGVAIPRVVTWRRR